MRQRDDEDLALDRIDTDVAHQRPGPPPAVARPSVAELQAELTDLRERIGRYPEHLVDQLHAARSARAEAQRVADQARARIGEPAQPAGVCCAGMPWTPPNARLSANASSSPRRKSRRPPSASATSQAALPERTAWDTERRAYSASAPPSSTRSSRAAAAST